VRLSAVACSLALVLAACGNALPTAPPEAAMPMDTAAHAVVSSSRVVARESEADLASIEVIKGASAATLYGSGCTASVRIVTKVETTGVRARGRVN